MIKKLRLSICKLLLWVVKKIAPQNCDEGKLMVGAITWHCIMLQSLKGMRKVQKVLSVKIAEVQKREAAKHGQVH